MVMKAYLKSVFRTIKDNFGRFISICFITLISITCYSGLGVLSETVYNSVEAYYKRQNISNIIIKSNDGNFSKDVLTFIEEYSDVATFESYTQIDTKIDDKNVRLVMFEDLKEIDINRFTLKSGYYPELDNEVLVEQPSATIEERTLGEKLDLTLYGIAFEGIVSGIVENPLYFTKDGEVDVIDQEPLDMIVYCNKEFVPEALRPFIPTTDVALTISGAGNYDYFSKKYETYIDDKIVVLKNYLLDKEVDISTMTFLTLNENKGYEIVDKYCNKVVIITAIVPLFFMVVSCLVVSSTMTRTVEEERSIVGCFSSLGFKDGKIIFKYLIFCAISAGIGAILGVWIGLTLLPTIIYPGFQALFFVPEMVLTLDIFPGSMASLVLAGISLVITALIVKKYLKEKPAELLLPKTPPAGKKILLERIKFIWRPLPFKYKSSIRNLMRNKRNFFMTVLCVSGSAALIILGLSLLDVAKYDDSTMIIGMKETLQPIAGLIIGLALSMSIFVIYNLINLNISERTREIATLNVLGYRTSEVCLYIYREISIMTAIGALVGIPLGALLTFILLKYLEFGSLASVQWYTYFISAGLVIAFIIVVEILLIRKIIKIDMLSSLKSVD